VSVRQTEFPKRDAAGRRKLLAIAAIICVVSYGGLALTRQFCGLPTIWPTAGVMLAVLLGVRPNAWPAYVLAGYAANVTAMVISGFPFALAFEFPVVNFLEIIAIAFLLNEHVRTVQDLSKPLVLLRFMFLGAGVAPLLSVSLNMIVLHYQHASLGLGFFVADFLSHSLGLLTITPIVLALQDKSYVNFISSRKIWQALLVAILVLGTTSIVFAQSRYPFLFMVYPPLVLVVCMYRLPGGALALFAVTLISLGFTLAGHGPDALIPTHSPLERLIIVQIFAGEAAVLVLALSAVLGDLDRAREQLSIAKEALAQLAVTDGLTGLANRRRLDEALEQECRRAVRNQTCLALLMIDVDNFKAYNDQYGHQAGDDCLRAISSTIAKLSTRPGDLTARYGGEELLVLLPETGRAAAVAKAEQIRMAVVGRALLHAGNPAHGGVVTVSIGVSSYEPSVAVAYPHAILSWADKMLYEAKRTGRNKSVSSPISPAQHPASSGQYDPVQLEEG